MSNREQPVSSKAELLTPLMRTATVGSAPFVWSSGCRLVLKPITLDCFPVNCGQHALPHCTCIITSRVATFWCAIPCNPFQNGWGHCNNSMLWSHVDPL